jgi:hypothetical protein
MFDYTYEYKLVAWREFRDSLEEGEDPFRRAVEFIDSAPSVLREVNIWNQEEFPQPWDLIQQARFTDFCKILLICYTLQLTERFSQGDFEIHINTKLDNNDKLFLLYIDGDLVVSYCNSQILLPEDLPEQQVSQRIYVMPPLQ